MGLCRNSLAWSLLSAQSCQQAWIDLRDFLKVRCAMRCVSASASILFMEVDVPAMKCQAAWLPSAQDCSRLGLTCATSSRCAVPCVVCVHLPASCSWRLMCLL